MGVPALFRWLSQKYPKIISPVMEERPTEVEGQEVPVDTTKPNPNGMEFDNLYLDMNGIVHPCSHPEDRPAPENEEEMMLAVFEYTNRVVNMVRPRKLLMIAVDGVAPRAKMNQQRSRRFRSAKEAREKDEDKAALLELLKQQNRGPLEEGKEEQVLKKTWDSNAITPGTPFMNLLAMCLRYWCQYKSTTDPAWEKLKIIISDATVPGEGEHKIMEFVRSQRSSSDHDPNTRHVIYGLDADLIMLGLATHEPHFHVLREDVFFQESKGRTCRLCGQKGHVENACRGEAKQKQGEHDEKDNGLPLKPFIWLHVSILREYLAVELMVQEQPFRFDLERALDDWVFMCFFVGNDFLPHLPSLDIRENGIDTLIAIWRDNIPLMGGYVTKDGHVDLQRAQYILAGLAKQEDAIFRRRRQTDERKRNNAKRRKLEEEGRRDSSRSNPRSGRKSPVYNTPKKNGSGLPPDMPPLFAPGKAGVPADVRAMTHEMAVNRGAIYKANEANKSAAAVLKSKLLGQPANEETDSPVSANGDQGGPQESPLSALGKRKADLIEDDDPSTPGRNTPDTLGKPKVDDDEEPPDTVRMWESGYADRYYEQKFKVDPKDIKFRNKVAEDYVEGLAWVLLYYFQGCPSWTWYYPHHYAPFAADFVDLEKLELKFEKGTPFRPYEQLMGVMPAASNHTIPEVFRSLMSDEDSDIIDFYPDDFPIDLNGKKFAWQGVALLPFIDEKRLLKAMGTRYPLLSKEDVERNEVGSEVLIFNDQHPLYAEVTANFYSKRQGSSSLKLDPKVSEGLSGEVQKNPDYFAPSPLNFPIEGGGMPNLDEDHSISLIYDLPKSEHIHKSMLLRGLKPDPPALDSTDIEATKGRSRNSGRSFGGAPFRGNGRNRGGGGRGDRINYAADSRPNPFAGYVQPGYQPPQHPPHNPPAQYDWRGPPPPGYPPPGYPPVGPPPRDYGYQGQGQSYNQGYPPHGGYGQPPPPPPSHWTPGQGDNRDQRRDYQDHSYRGPPSSNNSYRYR